MWLKLILTAVKIDLLLYQLVSFSSECQMQDVLHLCYLRCTEPPTYICILMKPLSKPQYDNLCNSQIMGNFYLCRGTFQNNNNLSKKNIAQMFSLSNNYSSILKYARYRNDSFYTIHRMLCFLLWRSFTTFDGFHLLQKKWRYSRRYD